MWALWILVAATHTHTHTHTHEGSVHESHFLVYLVAWKEKFTCLFVFRSFFFQLSSIHMFFILFIYTFDYIYIYTNKYIYKYITLKYILWYYNISISVELNINRCRIECTRTLCVEYHFASRDDKQYLYIE